MRKLFFFILLLESANPGIAQDKYIVSVPEIRDKKVIVSATLYPDSDTVLMSRVGADHLQQGWAEFVSGLSAESGGKSIDIKPLGGGMYLLSPFKKGERVQLLYTVNITHAKEKWPSGYKDAAYETGDMLVSTGNALFITRTGMSFATVQFNLPDKYQIITGWKQTAKNTYFVEGPNKLVWTILAIGKFKIKEIQSEEISIQVAFSDELLDFKKFILTTLEKAAIEYREIYGDNPIASSPRSSNYIIIMTVDTGKGGGAVYYNTIGIKLPKLPPAENKGLTLLWQQRVLTHTLIHELGHLWNGQSIRTGPENDWFTEGLTDYVAYQVEYKLGLITKDEFLTTISAKKMTFDKSYGGTSLEIAGSNKSENYDVIYCGGFLMAEMMDEYIRLENMQAKNLTDFLQTFYEEFSKEGRVFDLEDIKRVFGKTCNCDPENLFQFVKTGKLVTKS